MRKLMMTTALGSLAMATAADAQLARAEPSTCAYGYGAGDRDLVIEIASLDLPAWSGLALA